MSLPLTRRDWLRGFGTGLAAWSAGCHDVLAPGSETTTDGSQQGIEGSWRRFQNDRRNRGFRPGATGPSGSVTEFWTLKTGGTVMGTPVVVDGTVYAGSGDTNLYAVDTATGEPEWRLETEGAVARTPTVFDDTVYVGSEDGSLYAVDADAGTVSWTFDATVDAGEYSSPMVRTPPTVADGRVFFGDTTGRLFAVTADAGEEVWRFRTGGSLGVVTAPAVANGTVYANSYDGSLYALSAAEGTERWEFAIADDAAWSAPTVAMDTVYAGANDRHLYAIDAATGTERWRYRTGGHVFSSPAVDEETVYVGGGESVYAIAASDGRHAWRFTTGGYVHSSPAVVGDVVYVGSYDGRVYALDAGSRRVRWTFDVGAKTVSGPAVVEDAVLVGDFSGDVHAIGPATATSGAPGVTSTPAATDAGPDGAAATRWWPAAGHDARNTSHNPASEAPTAEVGVAEVLGVGGTGPPAVVDGTAYVVGPEGLVALDLQRGDRRYAVDVSTERGPGTPAVTGDTVYVHGSRLQAVDRPSGRVRWTLGGDSDLLAVTPPTVVDDTVYVGRSVLNPARGDRLGASGIYAVDAADGTRKWYNGDVTAEYGAIAASDGRLYVGSADDSVYALDAESGTVRWAFETGHSVLSAPAVVDGTVFVGSLDNTLYGIDAGSGDRRWAYETFGSVQTSPAVADGTVYAVSGGLSAVGNVYAVDATTGDERWTFECKRPVPLYTPVVADGVVYVQLAEEGAAGTIGTIYGLDAGDGSIVARVDPRPATPFAPVPADGAVYALLAGSRSTETTTPTPDATGRPRRTPAVCRVVEGAGSRTTETCEPRERTGPRATVVGPWPSEQHDAANTGRASGRVGVLYLATHHDGVYAVDASDGSVEWSSRRVTGVQSAPTVANGRVYVGVNRSPYGVHAFDAADGTRLWTARVGSCKASVEVAGSRAYVGTDGGRLVALDATDGGVRWTAPGNGRLVSTPTERDGTVYVGDEAGSVYAVDASDGTREWEALARPEDEVTSPVAADGDLVYATSVGGRLYALDAASGRREWRYDGFDGVGISGPAVAGGRVLVAGRERVHAVDADDGTPAWRFATGDGAPTTATVADGTAYVGSSGGSVSAASLADGTERWRFDVGSPVTATPVVGRDRVFVATRRGRVHAIDRASGRGEWRTRRLGAADKMFVDGALAAVERVEADGDG